MGKLKKVIFEIPESAYLMDVTYYWKDKKGTVKAVGTYDESHLIDGHTLKGWSNDYLKTEKREESD